MTNVACQLEHSIDVEVSPEFAWSWRTDIRNWDDPPAEFQLEGPFAAGSWGLTILPGQEPSPLADSRRSQRRGLYHRDGARRCAHIV